MRVLHVISSISRQGGGPSRSSQGLVAGLRAAGVDAWLMTLSHGEEPWIRGCEQFVNGGAFEEALAKVKPDLVHLHGLWDPRLHRCAVICRRRHIPYVIAPRGMLEPWSLKTKWLKKRIARFLYQDRDLKHAAALHATAESEAAQFRALGFKGPIIISPNGVNVPEEKKIGGENRWTAEGRFLSTPKTYTSDKKRRALFVSRMHPKKGVLELVESWARVFKNNDNLHCTPTPTSYTSFPWQCELVYTLNGDTEREYEAKVKQRILDLGMTYEDRSRSKVEVDNGGKVQVVSSIPTSTVHLNLPPQPDFILTGPLDDDAKWQAYARANLFILPTYSENFGIVVAEALWAGLPVITTKGTPWSELEGTHPLSTSTSSQFSSPVRCGWWIDLPEEKSSSSESKSKSGMYPCHSSTSNYNSSLWPALDQALREACGAEGLRALPAMGANGHRLVEAKYTWGAVVKAMVHGYDAILTDRNPV